MKHRIAFAMIMGIITTGIVSFTLIAVNVGFIQKFMAVWVRSWALAYLVAIPAILLISPRVMLFVDYLFRERNALTEEEIDTAGYESNNN